MAAHSPASSPRLPSPPPIAEDQIGPTSPGVSLYEERDKFPGGNNVDTGASRRIRPGTKAEDMAEGPPLIELQDIDSAFQLTEHLKALHHHHTHPDASNTIHPITTDIAKELSTPPANTSKDIWLYELGRFLIQKTNAIIVALFQDIPPCSPQTCPEMRASEWQYLCAVHDPPKSCAAIDYCCHTLDWAATTLTSSKMFPSRLGLGSGSGTSMGNDKVLQQQMKEIKNIFRRVYRIYAHAWFQHREMFWRVESKTGLYIFFKMVCDEYGIIETENYTIPAEAEGLEPEPEQGRDEMQAPNMLRRDQDLSSEQSGGSPKKGGEQEQLGMNDTTKRHRHTMSDYSSGVHAVIQEEAEEEESDKPLPDNQTTALDDSVDEPTTETTDAIQWDEPAPGVARSDTIKPRQEVQSTDEGEMTVLDTSVADIGSDNADEDMTPISTEPQEQSAADGDAADKTVGD
ncbi:hypothetical protein LTR37_004521 [Vermiconidia calcicola]|uniref:Uncharacterized protein n=1 Tax=Vermiconidia calcicola TaxID=1690605 RepID=A0ACC3NLW2_9PEZI|nr:hypothetical protein LTR37_004521 [Vermiconidia calcicola]